MDPADADNRRLFAELESVRRQVESLLADEAEHLMASRNEGREMDTNELQSYVAELAQRIDRLEAGRRAEIIRTAARFAGDVLVARGRAPLGWDGETRFTFEEELGKYLSAELEELDQHQANAMAVDWMELAPAEQATS